MLTCAADSPTGVELRREVEANTVMLGVCTGFFSETMSLEVNHHKAKFLVYSTEGGGRF